MRQPLRRRFVFVAVAAIVSLAPGSRVMALGPERPDTEVGTRRTIDDFINFRAELGLRTDRAYVESVTDVAPEWGIPLTASERADLTQRIVVQTSLGKLHQYQSSVPGVFGGMFIDQRNGGVLDIALTAGADKNVIDTMRRLASRLGREVPHGCILAV